MTIPKGSEYTFIVTVMERDSFLPQSLTHIDLLNSSFKLTTLDTLCDVAVGNVTIAVEDAVNGRLSVTLDSALTNSLKYTRGEEVDGYYPRATYQGVVEVRFTDATPKRVAIIPGIKVAPTGSTCE